MILLRKRYISLSPKRALSAKFQQQEESKAHIQFYSQLKDSHDVIMMASSENYVTLVKLYNAISQGLQSPNLGTGRGKRHQLRLD